MKKIFVWIKSHVILTTIISLLIATIAVPVIINELYKINKGYITEWGAADVLDYYGSVLSFISTTILGVATIILSVQANRTNDRLLELEYSKNKPCLKPVLGRYSLYFGKELKETEKLKNGNNALLITPLFVTQPRSGLTTTIAVLSFKITNTGNSNIESIHIDSIDFGLAVTHNLMTINKATIQGDTSFKINETRNILFEFKQEFFEDKKDEIINPDLNDTDIMPYIFLELTIITQEGIKFKEQLNIETDLEIKYNNGKANCLRSLQVSDLKIDKI